jgi:hypothetical protein
MMVYTVTGCLYIMIFGLAIIFRQVVQGEDVLPFKIYENEQTLKDLSLNRFNQLSSSRLSALPALFPLDVFFPGRDFTRSDNSSAPAFSWSSLERAELLFGIRVPRTIFLVLLYYTAIICIGERKF